MSGWAGSDAAALTTGVELEILLAAIGNPIGEFKISAMVNSGNHDFLSNQLPGGLPAGQGNVGGDGAGTFIGALSQVNLNNFAGQQYFTVLPSPGGVAVLAIAGAAAGRRRRA